MPLLSGQQQLDAFVVVAFLAAWFAQMGLHEGAHAWMADKLGDHLPRAMGKVTFNPFRHIEWNNPNYVISAVVLPVVTTLSGFLPIGMAWVYHSRMDTKSEAKIAIAGPIGSFAVGFIALALWWAIFPTLQELDTDLVNRLYQVASAFLLTSVVYGVFNLFPIPPLDGGTVAYHFMNHEGRRVFDQIRPYGFFIIIAVFWVLRLHEPLFSILFQSAQDLLISYPRMVYN